MIVFVLGLLITIFIFQKIFFGKTIPDQIKKESEKTRKIYNRQIPDLLPWTPHDMELLSYYVHQKSERKGFGHTFRGIFTSIYQEDMLIFHHKKPFAKSDPFTIAITTDHEIWYDPKNNVYVNGEFLGRIDKENCFANKKLQRTFGKIVKRSPLLYEIINEKNEITGSIKVPEDWDLPFPRAVEIRKDLNQEEIILFKILGCKKIIETYFHKHQKHSSPN